MLEASVSEIPVQKPMPASSAPLFAAPQLQLPVAVAVAVTMPLIRPCRSRRQGGRTPSISRTLKLAGACVAVSG